MFMNSTSQNTGLLLTAALVVPVLAQMCQIPFRGIDPDELEHLHAAYCVHLGQVPYRDFFEHHAPALYYFVQPLFWWRGNDLSVLWYGRLLMWACSCGTLVFAALAARRIAGKTAGLLAPTLLAWTSIFFAKGIELRPDVPATLLLTAVLWISTQERADSGREHWLFAGFLLGAATLFTQKAIVPAAGIAVGMLFHFAVTRETTSRHATGSPQRSLVYSLGALTVGGVFAWVTALIPFAAANAGGVFLNGAIVRLLHWSVHSPVWDYLRPAVLADTTVWCASLIGIGVWLPRVRRRRVRQAESIVVGVAIVGAFSLFWIKARYPQYYLLWYPALCIVAAKWLRIAIHRPITRRVLTCDALVLAVLSAMFSLIALRAVTQGRDGTLAHLYDEFHPTAAALLIVGPPACVALIASIFLARKRHRAACIALAAFGLWYAGVRHLDSWFWSNRDQVAAIQTVNDNVSPDGTVFDGFTGFGALRRHAWYYWWLNDYSLALIPTSEMQLDLPKLLKASPPEVILFDENLKRLPGETLQWIRDNYRPGAPEPIRVRRLKE